MDSNYWENFYSRQNVELRPSLFANYVDSILDKEKKNIVELGCGNGRDAIFFANEGYNVNAIDQCKSEIAFLQTQYVKLTNLKFRCEDFTNLNNEKFDVIYSRFTLHSINKVQEKRVLEWSYRNLNEGGLFCIEVRGQKNEIYKLGKQVENEEDAYIYDDHYRRFLNFDTLCNDLKNLGFNIVFAAEEKGFAPFNGQDETYIRVVVRK